MPHVVAVGGDASRFTGGISAFDVEATTFGALVRELDRRWPGLGEYVADRMAIAIDGEIHQDAYSTVLSEGSEIYLIPKIGGG